jgi:hypothetical protein
MRAASLTISIKNLEVFIMEKTNNIRKLNDSLRVSGVGGCTVVTKGFMELDEDKQVNLFIKIKEYTEFTEENDPYEEHDFGLVIYNGIKVFWKIDYYDQNLEYRSSDPANHLITKRVMTVMLAEEY